MTDGGQPVSGRCYFLQAFDLGFQIDLDHAARLLANTSRAGTFRSRRRAPQWFDYAPMPLRFAVDGRSVSIVTPTAEFATDVPVDVMVHDFGAALLTFTFPLEVKVDELPGLATALFEHEGLLSEARRIVSELFVDLRTAIERPNLAETTEDYFVVALSDWGGDSAEEFIDRHRSTIARTIEAEEGALAAQQIERVTEGRISYSDDDIAVIDWNGAVLCDRQCDDVLAVLKHANLELLQLRILDDELDRLLDHADETMGEVARRHPWPSFQASRMARQFATVQTDAAVLFEGVNNAIKLLGNQYLARLYRLTGQRLDLPAWQQSVQRKLSATESVYHKISDVAGTRRLETLEWVIIVLITISIVLPLTPWYGHG